MGVAPAVGLHLVNGVVFLGSVTLAISEGIGIALITAVASIFNTWLLLRANHRVKETHRDIKARRLVVVRYGDGEDETVVISPEERRVLEDLRHSDQERRTG